MYTLFIGVPFRRQSPTVCEVATDWGKSLLLLRDALGGRFGPITVAAPQWTPKEGLIGEQIPFSLDSERDDIHFVPLGEAGWRTRHYWQHFFQIRHACNRLAAGSQVIHAGINHLWQPYALMGFHAGVHAKKTTLLVLDGDDILRRRDLARCAPLGDRLKNRLYSLLYYQIARRAVARADLPLLKGRGLHQRYGRFTTKARDFHDTSYRSSEIIASNQLERKCRDVLDGQPIRCLALGRLIQFKGVDQSIETVVQAVGRGVRATLDIIGEGPDESRLRALADKLNAHCVVRFVGSRAYGPQLLREIASYHIHLFTPAAGETPRSLFDTMAGGAALLAYDIPYTRQVIEECCHGFVVPMNTPGRLADKLEQLHRDRPLLTRLMRQAAQAAAENSADIWYRRRAQWTLEAYAARAAATANGRQRSPR